MYISHRNVVLIAQRLQKSARLGLRGKQLEPGVAEERLEVVPEEWTRAELVPEQEPKAGEEARERGNAGEKDEPPRKFSEKC